jgi:tetratricopeptide (TPR) repeat protein
MRAAVFAFIALTFTSPLCQARADEPQPPTVQAAQHHFEIGVNFYKTGDYEAARIEFEAGYRLSKLPDFLVNLCQVADKQNRIQEAVNYCEQYLRIEPNAKDSAEVRTRLDRLHQQLGSPAQPTLSPTPAPSLSPAVTAQPATSDRPRSQPPAGALVLLMGGGALLVGGAGTGSAALATAKEIEAGPAFDDLAGLQRRGEALNIGAITLSVVGGFSAAIGTGWFVYWLRERSKPKPNR